MKKLNKKGFTLIELMIVIAIIAILAAILVPNFVKARAQGQLTACKSNLKNIGTAAEMYSADHNGRYPTSQEDFTKAGGQSGSGYLKVLPMCPTTPDQGYKYAAQSNPDFYYVYCAMADHRQAGIHDERGWPQFDSQMGLCSLTDEEVSKGMSASTFTSGRPSGAQEITFEKGK